MQDRESWTQTSGQVKKKQKGSPSGNTGFQGITSVLVPQTLSLSRPRGTLASHQIISWNKYKKEMKEIKQVKNIQPEDRWEKQLGLFSLFFCPLTTGAATARTNTGRALPHNCAHAENRTPRHPRTHPQMCHTLGRTQKCGPVWQTPHKPMLLTCKPILKHTHTLTHIYKPNTDTHTLLNTPTYTHTHTDTHS